MQDARAGAEGESVTSPSASSQPQPHQRQSVGTDAERLLEALKKGNKAVAQEIDGLRHNQRSTKSSRAAQSRMKVLRALGMTTSAPCDPETAAVPPGLSSAEEVKVTTAAPSRAAPVVTCTVEEMMNFEDVDEDLRCCVCQEGYHFQPEEVLCVYTYVKPVAVAAGRIATGTEGDDDEDVQMLDAGE
ncbi:unnamed protein product, partial [Polarella glacialis]